MENNIKEILEEILPNFNDKEKENVYKYSVSLSLANKQTYDLIKEKGIVLTKAKELKVLAIDPKTMLQALELAEKMDFLDAYKQDPTRLCQLVTNVIKRLAKLEAMGIPYKNEEGKFANFVFSERKFAEKMKSEGVMEGAE